MTTIVLPRSNAAWGTPQFDEVFREEAGKLDPALLPLQAGLSQGSHAIGEGFSLLLLGSIERDGCLQVKAGVFYRSVIGGCNCADDPTPVDELTEYCEVRFEIDRETAQARVQLLAG